MNEVEIQNSVTADGARGDLRNQELNSRVAASLESQRVAEKAGALVMQARRAHKADQKAEARNLLQQALAISSTDIGALELLGDIFLEEAEQEKALKVFEHGARHHPGHRAFEEKIALCILDLEEMKRHRERLSAGPELGALENWMQLSPQRALGLSVLLPGAGHVYAEENERGGWLFGIYLLSTLGWVLPLYFGIGGATQNGAKGWDKVSAALGGMGIVALWFWLMAAIGFGVWVYAVFDSMAAVERNNDRRKLGLDEFGF